MYNLLRSDIYRLARNRYVAVIVILSLLLVVFSAASLVARARTGQMVQLGLYSSESLFSSASSLPDSASRGLGQMLLGGNLYPLMATLLTCALMLPDLREGMRKRVLWFGRKETSYVVERYVLAAALDLLLLGVMAVSYMLLLAFADYTFIEVEDVGRLFQWLFLVWMNTVAYTMCAVTMLWGIRRLSVSLVISIAVSVGLAGVLATWLFGGLGANLTVQLLPYSVRQVLVSGSDCLVGRFAGMPIGVALLLEELATVLAVCAVAWLCRTVKRWS